MVWGCGDGKRDDSHCNTRSVNRGDSWRGCTASVAREDYRIDVVMCATMAPRNALRSVVRDEAVQLQTTGTPTTSFELDWNDSFGSQVN